MTKVQELELKRMQVERDLREAKAAEDKARREANLRRAESDVHFKAVRLLEIDFRNISAVHCKFGATDTEPRGVFADICVRALTQEERQKFPQSARQWMLYSQMAGNREAAKDMTRAARKVAAYIRKHRDAWGVQYFVREYHGWY